MYGGDSRAVRRAAAKDSGTANKPPLAVFIEILKASAGPNFRRYKTGTLRRCIERRMALRGAETWRDYPGEIILRCCAKARQRWMRWRRI